ncbi:MAG: adenylyl-sulfate kinase [Candidatus Thorarchaeota archaeon]|jgi:sulfate adenylyltransferase
MSGTVVWFTGLPGSGKTTLAKALVSKLEESGNAIELIDSEDIRRLLGCWDLSPEGRSGHVKRIGLAACLLAKHGITTVCALVSPQEDARRQCRLVAERTKVNFILIHLDPGADVCEARDPKGNWAAARAGKIDQLVGVNLPYEIPRGADLKLDTDKNSVEECIEQVLKQI